ncbi:hypothetical protein [Bacillus sp. Cs-700]|uniref:hypothetical protein n=1 Tax=Bacillus sp. Cs-700 TaxID=2589818 RepID=UPI001408216D|nr:hypothetical protein [Bacillus sp. Cs-700]
MTPVILTIITVTALFIATFIVFRKRKAAGLTGIKSALTPMFLFLIAIVNLLAYWFDFNGMINWVAMMVFLLLGAYFTKYTFKNENKT